MTVYEFVSLSDEVLLVRWIKMPTSEQSRQFAKDLSAQFDQATKPFYVVSDLRKGYVIDAISLREMASLMNHKNYAGSTAFGSGQETTITGIFVGLFNRLGWSKKASSDVWSSPEEAIEYLETLKPGITSNIDRSAILNE